jgi:hypothetical protein
LPAAVRVAIRIADTDAYCRRFARLSREPPFSLLMCGGGGGVPTSLREVEMARRLLQFRSGGAVAHERALFVMRILRE